jgi:GNAT superfamily N-acetyltransferase
VSAARPAGVGDAAGLARIQVRAWHHAFADIVFPEHTPTVADQTEAWTVALAAGVRAFVVDVAGEPRGFAAYGQARDPDAHQDGLGELYALFVDPTAQGAGLGRILLDEAVGALRMLQFEGAVLWTPEQAPAREIYERRGWELDIGAVPEHGVLQVPEVRYRLEPLPA